MAERQLTLPGPIVKKSNQLARAAWPAQSVFEPRLVALVASRVTVEDEDFKEYKIPIDELFREDGGETIKRVEAVSDSLQSRVITIPDEDGWTKYNVFMKSKFSASERCIIAQFHPDLKPHYLALKGHFTQYALFEFLLLPSVYSQRIFEILKSWQPSYPEITLPIQELYEQLDVPDSHKKDFGNFRKRVLVQAHRDIHKHTSLRYEWEPIKRGRSVVGVRFVFSHARVAPVATTKRKKAITDESAKKNAAVKAAIACFAKCQAQCTSRPGLLQCDLCKKIIQPQQ
jgi:plasmid replication initiation protein